MTYGDLILPASPDTIVEERNDLKDQFVRMLPHTADGQVDYDLISDSLVETLDSLTEGTLKLNTKSRTLVYGVLAQCVADFTNDKLATNPVATIFLTSLLRSNVPAAVSKFFCKEEE